NTAVLQEPAHNAADANPVADAPNSGPQSTNPSHDEINLHSGLGCTIESRDDVLIEERVHFCDDVCRPAEPSVIALTRNQIKTVLRNIYRRNHQRRVAGVF